jgi:hypothetical protein
MSTFNSHDSYRPRRNGKAEPVGPRPDPMLTIVPVPAPAKPKRSLTDVDEQRADGEGMTRNKPTKPPPT